jgi:PAS domain S-box-containing protein
MLQEDGINIGKDISNDSIDYILTEKHFGLKLMLYEHKKMREDIEYIFILTEDGKLLAHSYRGPFPDDLRDANHIEQGQEYNIQKLSSQKGNILDIALPILNGELGVVRVGILEHFIIKDVNDITKIIVWTIIGISVFGSIITIIISSSLTKPISTLTKGAEEISKGNLEYRTDINTNDEIGRLASSFNKMVKNLKSAEDKLRKSNIALLEERDTARKYLDTVGVMLIVIGIDQKIRHINKKACDILECKEEEIIGKNWFDNFIPQRNMRKVKVICENLMAGEIEAGEYFEYEVLTMTGEEKIIGWHYAVLTDEKGDTIGTISSGVDITDRKKIDKTLIDKMEELVRYYKISGRPYKIKEITEEINQLRSRLESGKNIND